MFAGQILKRLVEKKFVRMSERELESSDEIKEKLLACFKDPNDAGVRKLSSQIMSKMLINGGYYSWDQLIDFFVGFLKFDSMNSSFEHNEIVSQNVQIDIAENSIEAIALFVQNFSNPLEDESCYH